MFGIMVYNVFLFSFRRFYHREQWIDVVHAIAMEHMHARQGRLIKQFYSLALFDSSSSSRSVACG